MSRIDPDVEAARQVLASRHRRGRFLPVEVLGEPAWDLLLDLLVSAADGVAVPLKSACVAAGVPPTTAMRCVHALEVRGVVASVADPRDRRRKLLVLTSSGEGAVRAAARDAFGTPERAAAETARRGEPPRIVPRGSADDGFHGNGTEGDHA